MAKEEDETIAAKKKTATKKVKKIRAKPTQYSDNEKEAKENSSNAKVNEAYESDQKNNNEEAVAKKRRAKKKLETKFSSYDEVGDKEIVCFWNGGECQSMLKR